GPRPARLVRSLVTFCRLLSIRSGTERSSERPALSVRYYVAQDPLRLIRQDLPADLASPKSCCFSHGVDNMRITAASPAPAGARRVSAADGMLRDGMLKGLRYDLNG